MIFWQAYFGLSEEDGIPLSSPENILESYIEGTNQV